MEKVKKKTGCTDNFKNTGSISGELIGILISYIMLFYIIPRFKFISTDYSFWVSIGFSASVLSALFRMIGKLIPYRGINHLFEMLAILPSLYSIYFLIYIFPFDFSLVGYSQLNDIIKFALIISLFALSIAIIVHAVKFIAKIVVS